MKKFIELERPLAGKYVASFIPVDAIMAINIVAPEAGKAEWQVPVDIEDAGGYHLWFTEEPDATKKSIVAAIKHRLGLVDHEVYEYAEWREGK